MRIQKQDKNGFEEVEICLILPIPPSKNRMFTVRYDYNIRPRLIHTNEVRDYYEMCQSQYFGDKRINSFRNHWNKNKLIRIEITYYLKDMRRDTHGMLPVLLDALEKILQINDRYFIVTEKARIKSEEEKITVSLSYEKKTEEVL